MPSEYVIARIMHDFALPYNFAYSIYMDLEKRNLLDDFLLKMDRFEDFEDFYGRYFYGGQGFREGC